jgi:hypothetical protein
VSFTGQTPRSEFPNIEVPSIFAVKEEEGRSKKEEATKKKREFPANDHRNAST